MDRAALDVESAASAGDVAALTGETGRGRKNLFGRADLAEVYRRARDLLVKHGVFRMVQVAKDGDGASSLVICNLWRIDRSKQGAIKTLEFDMATGQWAEVGKLDYWPDVPLYPIQKAQTLDWWREVATRVVWKALMTAGYGALPRHLTEAVWDERGKVRRGPPNKAMPESPKLEMTPNKMAYILVQRYIGKKVPVRTKKKGGGYGSGVGYGGKEKWKNGFLKPKVMIAGAKALRASIFDHVLDADVLSAILAIDYNLVTLRDYLSYAVHRDALLRVSREHRNLLPMLPQITKEHWGRKDLFSRKLWVKDGRSRTLVDYTRFSENKVNCFASLDSRAALRWLGKAQLTVVRRWASPGGGGKNVAVLENLSRANITVKIPAIAWSRIVTAGAMRSVARLGVSEWVQRLYRAFAVHCAAVWKAEGFVALKAYLKNDPMALSDVADWLAAEGIAQGFPDKHATWESIRRRCDDWHERVAIENVERSAGENHTWDSLLDEAVIDDVIFTPLNSVKDVALEGYRQQHCVGNYADYCVDGRYRVYAALEPDGTRSTLGLWFNDSGRWVLEQHRGKYNGSVSVEAAKAGQELVGRYQAAYLKKVGAA